MDLTSKELLYKQYNLSVKTPPRAGETYFCYWFKGTMCYYQGAAVWDGMKFNDPDPENLKGRQPTIWLLPYEGKKRVAYNDGIDIDGTRFSHMNGIDYEPE